MVKSRFQKLLRGSSRVVHSEEDHETDSTQRRFRKVRRFFRKVRFGKMAGLFNDAFVRYGPGHGGQQGQGHRQQPAGGYAGPHFGGHYYVPPPVAQYPPGHAAMAARGGLFTGHPGHGHIDNGGQFAGLGLANGPQRSYGELLRDLDEVQAELEYRRNEVAELNGKLEEARATRAHDRYMITQLQLSLASYRRREAATRASGRHVSSRRRAGTIDDAASDTTCAFPAFDPDATAENEVMPYPHDQVPGSLVAANPGFISQPDLFNAFPSMAPGQDDTAVEPVYDTETFTTCISELWEKTEKFARDYTVTREAIAAEDIKGGLLKFVIWGFTKEAVLDVITNPDTRFWAVHKAINSYLVQEIFRGGGFREFDRSADAELGELRRVSSNNNLPYSAMRFMFIASTKGLTRVRNMPLFHSHITKKTHANTQELFDILSPLIQTHQKDAWLAMADIVKSAHQLALKMFSGPYQFKYSHAVLNEVFSPTVMLDRLNVTNGVDPAVFSSSRFRVRFATTPALAFRNVARLPPPQFDNVSLSQVLLVDLDLDLGLAARKMEAADADVHGIRTRRRGERVDASELPTFSAVGRF